MKLFVIADNTSASQQSLENRLNLKDGSFDDMYSVYQKSISTGILSYLSEAIKAEGFEIQVINPNFKILQTKWAEENGVKYSDDDWKIQILKKQIKVFEPSILYIIGGWNYAYNFVKEIKEIQPQIRKTINWIGEFVPEYDAVKHFDIIFTCDPNNLDKFKMANIDTYHINHSFSPDLFEKLEKKEKVNEIVFAGSFKQGEYEHNYRAKMVYYLLNHFKISLFGKVHYNKIYAQNYRGKFAELYHYLIKQIESITGVKLSFLPKHENYLHAKELGEQIKMFNKIELNIKPPLFGLEYFQLIKDSSVLLNTHSNTPYACNMRLFEGPGLGTCLLTDWKINLSDLYDIDNEIVSFKNEHELLDKAKFLLNNIDKAIEIGENARKRVIKSHMYHHRVPIYLDIFKKI